MSLANTKCPLCESRTDIVDRLEHSNGDDEPQYGDSVDDEDSESLASFESCRRCRYWRWHFVTQNFYNRGGALLYQYRSYGSKLQEFSATLPPGCKEELAQWLRRRPDAWHLLDPRRMERFVTDIYRANFGDADVTHIGRSGDGGVDVLMVRAEGERWLIQVKRRASETKRMFEGVGTLRELLGAMVLDGARIGAVVTSADHFSYAAHAAARRAGEVGFVVELVDRGRLNEMVGRLLPRTPWLPVIAERYALYAAWLRTKVPVHDAEPGRAVRTQHETSERRLLLDAHGKVLPLRIRTLRQDDGALDKRQLPLFCDA
jgi:hypothetical protein